MSFPFESNPSQGYQMVRLHQKALLKEFYGRNERPGAGESAERRSRTMNKLRHWVLRLVPFVDRTML